MDDDEDRFVVLTVGGEEIKVERARAQELAARMRASPDGDGSDGIFAAMSQLPGHEIGPARPLDPSGPEDPDGPAGEE